MKNGRAAGRQVFLFTLAVSLFLLLTAVGIIVVDWQGRRLSFGDGTPPFRVEDGPAGGKELQIDLLGLKKTVDITAFDKIWDFLCDFSCIPHN